MGFPQELLPRVLVYIVFRSQLIKQMNIYQIKISTNIMQKLIFNHQWPEFSDGVVKNMWILMTSFGLFAYETWFAKGFLPWCTCILLTKLLLHYVNYYALLKEKYMHWSHSIPSTRLVIWNMSSFHRETGVPWQTYSMASDNPIWNSYQSETGSGCKEFINHSHVGVVG